jgi:hypothetical protein
VWVGIPRTKRIMFCTIARVIVSSTFVVGKLEPGTDERKIDDLEKPEWQLLTKNGPAIVFVASVIDVRTD